MVGIIDPHDISQTQVEYPSLSSGKKRFAIENCHLEFKADLLTENCDFP